ncbi:hypothetical protein QBC40DRAFT_350414 [Triangularia verruculosa]|uniref:Uncharacterized protein n=1 Tax=Triangularia verruculosa TaxID=2587418 RepID=A0AAN7ATN5_9PEZI|nr:hypothetical protein QBC40DRAFT_350414 [Triangularia verruculosa]
MAPVLTFIQEGNVLSPRWTIPPHCIGWDCLSESAQAGVIIISIVCALLGWYLWRKLGNSEERNTRRSSMFSNLTALSRLSRPGTPSDHRQSQRLSGSIYRRSHRLFSTYGRSQSRPISLSSIREERSRQTDDTSDSTMSPHVPRARHLESVDLTDVNRQLSAPVIPPPPGPAPILWMGGPTPIFVLPPAYTPTPSNDGHANEARYSLVPDFQFPPPPHMIPIQYGPSSIPRFWDGMASNDYPQGHLPQHQQALQLPSVGNQADTSTLTTAERPTENRRRTWFPFMKRSKRPGHGRSISESALPSRQVLSHAASSDMQVSHMRERGRNRLQRQPSIRLVDRSLSPQRQNSPRPYPRIGWRNQSPDHNLRDEDDQSDQSQVNHPSELSFPSVGTSMRAHDGITSSETASSVFDRDPHFEAHSPERRRENSLRMFRNPARESDGDADEEESTVRVFRAPKPKRLQRRKLYSSWMQTQQPSPPSPPSSDIQFPSPESQRVTFVEPTRRERDGLRERERRRRERTPAPRRARERSGERGGEGRERDGNSGQVRERSAEQAPTRRYRERSRERSLERASTRRHREQSLDRPDEDTRLPRHGNRARERSQVERLRENHPNLLERLRAVRAEMRGDRD